jgi:hypothetical protein
MDAKRVAELLRDGSEGLLGNLERSLREDEDFDEVEIQSTLAQAAAICAGELPEDCDVEYFDALLTLAEKVAEPVHIGSFLEFRYWADFEEIGIWPWMLRRKPPFPVPVCAEPGPQVGFLSVEDIAQIALPGFGRLPRIESADGNYAREEFKEVLESLVEDKLDLLAVLWP